MCAEEEEVFVSIERDADIVLVRQKAKALAERIGFSGSDLTLISTAVSEIARNIHQYASKGEIRMRPVRYGGQRGLSLIASDQGPGIPDIELAMRDGYSTDNGLGLGLPGARRLMDEFEIVSKVGNGTIIKMKKWCRD